ncbi:MAG TPA: PAS domain S-box protein [Roseimicrobium sp.]|nr:PAS domain S-box protein [Roseimicrobium sp.]
MFLLALGMRDIGLWTPTNTQLLIGGVALTAAIAAAIMAVVRDRVRLQTMNALREREERFSALVHNAPDYVMELALDGRLLYMNRVAPGNKAEDIIGKLTVFDFIAPEYHPAIHAAFDKVRQTGESTSYEIMSAGAGGKPSWFSVRVGAIRREGKIIGLMQIASDVTRSKEIENALRESEVRKAAVVAGSLDAIVAMNHEGLITEFNPAAEHLFGYTQSMALGKPLAELVLPEEEREGFFQGLAEYLVERESHLLGRRLELMAVRRTGERFPVEMAVTEATLPDHRMVFNACFRDLTEQRRAEAAVASTVEELRDLYDNAPCGYHSLDNNGVFVHMNATELRWLGYRREEVVGKLKWSDVITERSLVTFYESFPLLKERGSVRDLEFEICRKDGSTFTVLLSATAARDTGGRFVMSRATLIDISERKKAEQQIEKLAAFARFNPNPVLEFSMDGELGYFNDAAVEMAKSLGKADPVWILPASCTKIVRECLATGRPRFRVETRYGERTVSWSFFPIKTSGVVHCYAGDISERLQLEMQLRQSQKMESVGQLAGGVAHDFNNILTVIQGHASMMMMNPDLPADLCRPVEDMVQAADRAANLTRQLLTFSRKQALQPKDVDLNEVVTHLTRMLHRILGEHIKLQMESRSHLPLVHADVGMIEQALVNLAVNSRDAMPKGGTLTIRLSEEMIDLDYTRRNPDATVGRFVCLTVEDTGMGIPPALLPRIFEPFFTTKDVGKGTGLGLATVYGIVKQHNGWIRVSSELGQRTSFHLHFPAVSRQIATPMTPRKETIVAGGKETILIVEDESSVRELARSVLESYGYTVLEAASGPAALQVWSHHKHKLQLVLTDIMMPEGITGLDLGDRLRAESPSLKIVYTSGYSAEMAGRGVVFKEGLNFLQKPYRPKHLAEAIRRALDADVVPAPSPEADRADQKLRLP